MRKEAGTTMKLAVFGATGTAGSALTGKALAAGHDLRVLARTPGKITRTDAALSVLPGDAMDPHAVRRVVQDADAVVSMLGGFSDTDSIRVGTAVITAVMSDLGIRRIVIVQGYHLDFPGDPRNLGRKLILPMLYLGSRSLIRDSREMASAIQASGLDWTVVRVPRIIRGPSTGRVRTGALRLGPWDSVVNGDIADLVLRSLADPATFRTAPMIASARRSASSRSPVGAGRTLRDIVRPPRQDGAEPTWQAER
jgi:putative NADH-flavin reductase